MVRPAKELFFGVSHPSQGDVKIGFSCQDFAQKGPCLTLGQDDLNVTVG